MTAALAPTLLMSSASVPRGFTPVRVQVLPSAYVHPGQIAVSGDAGSLVTILGSCVAVCLHDPKQRVGGMNHFLLPSKPGPGEAPGRYAPSAIAQLLEQVLAKGALQQRLVAHIVGGASVLAAFGDQAHHLGRKNAEAARDILAGYRIPVIGTDVGGTRGRKLLFSPRDGSTLVQLIGV